MKKITILIVDDHKLIREMWRALFVADANIEIAGESGEMLEAIDLIKTKRPDIVLLDINLSNESGFDAVPLIRKYSPGTRIIAVSMHNQPAYAKKMMNLGVKGYITKNSPRVEMYLAIQEVMNGKIYLCAEIRELISDKSQGQEPSNPLTALSIREIDIIKLIKEGHSSKEIADKLYISQRTVEVHRHNILKKLGLKNTPALVSFIQETELNF